MQQSDILRIAAEAEVDPRTVRKILEGGEVRGRAGERARAAIERYRAANQEKQAGEPKA